MATKKRNSANQDYTNNTDGWDLSGGLTNVRKLTLSGADVAIVGSGTNVLTAVNRNATIGNDLNNFSTADQTINAATTALITGSLIAVPVGKLQIGTLYRCRFSVSKTAAGTAANNFLVKVGTNGTTADTTIATLATPTATGVADKGWIEISVLIRGPLSASCVAQCNFWMGHNLSTTGLANIPNVVVNTNSSTFNATTANLFINITCTTAASTVLTFQQVFTECTNL